MEPNIVISEDQNTVTIGDREFVAEENGNKGCQGCQIRTSFIGVCYQLPCTISFDPLSDRKDNREVIFKEQLKTE